MQHDDLMLIRASGIVTGRYAVWKPSHGVPIRTTVGSPRFWRGPPLVDGRRLAPWGLLDPELPTDVCRQRYEQRLDELGDEVIELLERIAEDHDGERLVLLCFENVHRGEFCHRRWLAEWIEDRYGIVVPELPEGSQQPTLF
jgi:hypothetical protein